MSKVKSKEEVREEYRREDLGPGVRAKYLSKVALGTNLVILEKNVAKAFPNSNAVNEALKGLLSLTGTTNKLTNSAKGRAKARR